MSGLRQADKVDKMLEFLLMAERRKEKYTPDQIMALTITLRKQENQWTRKHRSGGAFLMGEEPMSTRNKDPATHKEE